MYYSPKILVVEDHIAIRTMWVEGLKSFKKYRIYEAKDFDRAEKLLQSEKIDILILGQASPKSLSQLQADYDLSLVVQLSKEMDLTNLAKSKIEAFDSFNSSVSKTVYLPAPEMSPSIEICHELIDQIKIIPHQNVSQLLERAELSSTDNQSILLCVSQNQRIIQDLQKVTTAVQMPMIVASSAQKALRELRLGNVEYVFISNDQDDMTAVPLVRSIRKEKGYHLPIALLSTPLEVHDRIEAVHAGVSLFLHEESGYDVLNQGLRQLQVLGKAGSQKILIIDDDQGDLIHFIHQSLGQSSFQISSINSPLRLLELMTEIQTDLLLINCDMEEVGGFEVCRTLRTIPEWQSLPIILIGQSDDPAKRMAAFKSGADDYLSTHLETEELSLRISARLERMRISQERADRDALTGLLIRRAFNEAFQQKLQIAKRKGSVVSICLLDLDHFKSVNDTYGHLAGDRVLSALGRLLSSSFRAEDLRGRWWGEEFIVAFSGEDPQSAKSILERARQEFIKLEFEGENGEVFKSTFSSGIACYPDHGEHIEQILKIADERLYKVKQNGRNQILAKDEF